MKITHINYERHELKLRHPYQIAYETVSQATNFILRVETDVGLVGMGCAAPDVPVTGETPDMVEAAIQSVITPLLLHQNPFTYARLIEQLRAALPHQSSALSMVDSALFDLIAKRADVPLYQLLGGYRHRIATSITIGICSLEETLETARQFHQDGFQTLKVKGGLDVQLDIERMQKLREAFPHTALRFDGNQGYSVQQAIAFSAATRAVGIEILEQPTKVHQDEKLGTVTEQVALPVMADESLKTLADTFRLVRNERVNMINIKLMKVGGILEAMHINSVAKSDGVEVMIGCIDESSLGIAAGLHFALSRPNIQYADLDGHLDFLNDPLSGLFRLEKGWLLPLEKAGLGG